MIKRFIESTGNPNAESIQFKSHVLVKHMYNTETTSVFFKELPFILFVACEDES